MAQSNTDSTQELKAGSTLDACPGAKAESIASAASAKAVSTPDLPKTPCAKAPGEMDPQKSWEISPPMYRAQRPSWLWWAAFAVAVANFVALYVSLANKYPMHGSKLFTEQYLGRIDLNGTPKLKGGWGGWDFGGPNLAACLVYRTHGKEPIYPEKTPSGLNDWFALGRAVTAKYNIPAVSDSAYIYPPTLAVLLAPFAEKGPYVLAWRWIWSCRVMMVVLWILCVLILARTYGRRSWLDLAIDTVICGGMTILNYPVLAGAVESSNASILMACLTTASLLFLLQSRAWIFGLVFALSIQLKISPLIFLPWLIMRRQIKPVTTTIIFSIIWFAIALIGVGWDDHIRFVRVIMPWHARSETFYPNQSINGFILRWLKPGDFVSLSGAPLPLKLALACRISSMSVLAAVYIALWFLRRRPANAPRIAVEYCLLLTAGLAASPVAWIHHFAGMLVVWVLIYGALRYWMQGWKRWLGLVLFWCGWVMNSCYIEVAQHNWGWRRFYVSYVFYSLIVATVLLLIIHACDSSKKGLKFEPARDYLDHEDWDDIALKQQTGADARAMKVY